MFFYNYNVFPYFESPFYFFWYIKDSTMYWFSLLTVLISAIVNTFLERIYSTLLNQTLKIKNSPKPYSYKNHKLGSEDYKYLYYNWLLNTHNTTNPKVHNLFLTTNPTLFQGTFTYLKKIFNLNSQLFFTNHLPQLDETKDRFNYNDRAYLSLTLHQQILSHEINTNLNPSLKFLSNKDTYNLKHLTTLDSQLNTEFGTKQGNIYLEKFFFKDYNYLNTNYTLNSELNEALNNQTLSFKINRFLYHYNLLHSRILKNSHKITMTKKIISTGFYDLQLVDNNIWTSDFLSNSNDTKPFIRSELRSLYKNFFKNNFTLESLNKNYFLNKTTYSIKLVKFYENSYFFNLKRFFLFNNLGTQHMQLNKKNPLNTQHLPILNSPRISSKFTSVFKNNEIINHHLTNLNPLNNEILYNKNVVLASSEQDLFSYDDELILLNLTNSSLNKWNKFWYFNSTTQDNINVLFNNNTFQLSIVPEDRLNFKKIFKGYFV